MCLLRRTTDAYPGRASDTEIVDMTTCEKGDFDSGSQQGQSCKYYGWDTGENVRVIEAITFLEEIVGALIAL